MTPINKTYKRILWSILIGGIAMEATRPADNSNPGLLWFFVIPVYIILTLTYNRYIWKTAQFYDNEESEEDEMDINLEDEK